LGGRVKLETVVPVLVDRPGKAILAGVELAILPGTQITAVGPQVVDALGIDRVHATFEVVKLLRVELSILYAVIDASLFAP
jgi:hypothetical protein